MKFVIKHEIKGRLRVHLVQGHMSLREADVLEYCMSRIAGVISVKIWDRTCDMAIVYEGKREELIAAIRQFHYETAIVPEEFVENTGRKINRQYQDQLINRIVLRIGG